jgi:hypothetical protein
VYIPLEEQSEEDKKWMAEAVVMVRTTGIESSVMES